MPLLTGFRPVFLLFAIVGVYCLVFRIHEFLYVCFSTPVLFGIAFLILATAMELAHPHANLDEHRRIAYSLGGVISIATLTRSPRAVSVAAWSFMCIGVFLGVNLGFSAGSVLAEAGNIDGESLRDQTANGIEDVLANHVNTLSFIGVNGLVASLAVLLTTRLRWKQSLSLIMAILSSVAVIVPISRSGAIAAVVSVILLWKLAGRSLISVCAIIGVALMAVSIVYPGFYDRAHLTARDQYGNNRESRQLALRKFVETLPETVVFGIGHGNFAHSWGLTRGFPAIRGANQALETHNCYAQITLQWGLGAMLAYMSMTVLAAKAALRARHVPEAFLLLSAMSCVSFFVIMLSHGYESKALAISLGLLISAHCWSPFWVERTDEFANSDPSQGIGRVEVATRIFTNSNSASRQLAAIPESAVIARHRVRRKDCDRP
ncbi:MAG: O-antigen ligase family protein [Planctomycetota bacterium]|nr:O-antigen ligase family protein [Planctomycetota bacterium]